MIVANYFPKKFIGFVNHSNFDILFPKRLYGHLRIQNLDFIFFLLNE